jgi:hypothetical protein
MKDFRSLNNEIHIKVPHSFSELHGHLITGETIIWDYAGGYIIAKIHKICVTKRSLTLSIEVVPTSGQLVSKLKHQLLDIIHISQNPAFDP